ncbi:hypothetical protein EDC01DRAFT_662938 [Geopyxis carbonaria]|nr:hypothetical protein EDC01DRAFT_662938 [Geopyxis carbonaria]
MKVCVVPGVRKPGLTRDKTAWRFRMIRRTIILSLVRIATAAPSVSFPINAQIPPVAHVLEEFEFIFSPSTFTTIVPPMQYTLTSSPPWLQLDSSQRKLFGKPTEVGAVNFKISAIDSSGAIEHEATLVVAKEPASKTDTNLPELLSSIGPTDGKDAFILPPQKPFEFVFPENLFSKSSIEAVSADNTPLPSWITFDRANHKFTGLTPSLASQLVPPLNFGIKLVGSDFPGFGDSSLSFSIIIAGHILHFKEPYLKTNATVGEGFNYTLARDSLELDGSIIEAEKLASVSTNATGWIKFDPSSATLSGTPPKGTNTTTVIVTARDTDGNEARKVVEIVIAPSLFATDIPDVITRRGDMFEYTLNRTIFSNTDTKVMAKIGTKDDWISFDEEELKFQGKVPEIAPENVSIGITASLDGNVEEEELSIVVEDQLKRPQSTANNTTPDASQIADATSSESSKNASKRNSKKVLTICLATILPLLLVLGLAYMWFCVKRNSQSRPVSPATIIISRPVQPTDEEWSLAAENYTGDGSVRRFSAFVFKSPQLPIQTPKSSTFVSPVASFENLQGRGDSPTIMVTAPPPLDPVVPASTPSVIFTPVTPPNQSLSSQQTLWNTPKSPVIPEKSPMRNEFQKSGSEIPQPRSIILAGKTRDSRHYPSPTGQPHGQRMSGVGHGKPEAGGPPGYGTPKRSWRRTISSGNGIMGRESDNTLDSVSTGMLFSQPSVRLVSGSEAGDLTIEENSRNSSYTSRISTLPSIYTPYRRTLTMPSLPVTPNPLGYQDSLIDEVMSALSTGDHSQRASLGSPESPLHRFAQEPQYPRGTEYSISPSHTPSSTPDHKKRRGSVATEGSFMQVTDEDGHKIWYPKNSSSNSPSTGSERTGFTRRTGSCPYEPYEFGVALTSSMVNRPGADDLERLRNEDGQQRQRAKLVEFTRKRPVSDLGQQRNQDSSYTGDVAFL